MNNSREQSCPTLTAEDVSVFDQQVITTFKIILMSNVSFAVLY